MTIRHNLTGVEATVTKQTSKIIFFTVTKVPNPTPGVKVGTKLRTNPAAIGITYAVIDPAPVS